jgi:hypothetical protein
MAYTHEVIATYIIRRQVHYGCTSEEAARQLEEKLEDDSDVEGVSVRSLTMDIPAGHEPMTGMANTGNVPWVCKYCTKQIVQIRGHRGDDDCLTWLDTSVSGEGRSICLARSRA